MSSDCPESTTVGATLKSVRFVGPATAAVLEREGYDATAVTDKRVSFRMLVEAGVNPGVAAKIRREHSLSWSFNSGGDLDRRSTQIRGLGSAEAEWVAASAGDWADDAVADDDSAVDDEPDDQTDNTGSSEPTPWPTHGESEVVDSATADSATADSTAADTATTDGSGDAISAEAAWQARSKPTPVEDLAAVDAAAADQLAEAGITSVRSLATADVEHVADVLELPKGVVDEWYRAARAAHE